MTAGIIDGGSVRARYLKVCTNSVSVLLTYCHHYGPNCRDWKIGRLCYDSDKVSQGTLWLGDGYSVFSCTSPNIHTALVSPSTVGYPVPSHSGSRNWCSPGDSDTGGTHLCSMRPVARIFEGGLRRV